MTLSRRERWVALAAAGVLGLLLLDRVLITPLWHAWQVRSDRVLAMEREVWQTRQLLRQRRQIEADWRQRLDAGLAEPVSSAEAGLLNALEAAARQAGTQIVSLRPERPAAQDGVRPVRCRLVASGSLESLARFCWQLETQPGPLRLERVQISATDPARDAVNAQMEVSRIGLAPVEPSRKGR